MKFQQGYKMSIRSSSKLFITMSVSILVLSSPALSKNQGKLPKNAIPMATVEIQAALSGNTIDFKQVMYYFSPDGKLLAIDRKGEWFADGTWNVTGNTWCLVSDWHGPDKSKVDHYEQCSEKYVSGKKIYTKNTKGEDQWLGDISTDQEKKIKKGDLVSGKVKKLRAKLGYD